ncbi:MAG: hypothetical protein WAL08_18510 [Candidatus Sulfotelmatobacter sp.]
MNTEVSIETLKTERAGQPMTHRLAWIAGLREVFVKSPAGNRIGYFTDLEKALALLAEDGEYKAAWYSLNVCPRIPDGFQPDRLYRASARFNENDYAGRQQLLIDCDPKREADTASTDEQKAAAKAQALAVREFLDNLNFPDPVFADSGNGYHLVYAYSEPNDEKTKKLVRDFLAGLAVKFDNSESAIDTGNFEANRLCKLYGTVARKGGNPGLWRRSAVLEAPSRELELVGGERVTELAFDPVPRTVLQAAVAELPVPRDTKMGEMTEDAIRKTDWLRKLCEVGDVAILKERRDGPYFKFDIVCPREESHGSTTGESSTTISYRRGHGYGFSCLHASCSSKDEKRGIRSFKDFRREIDPKGLMSDRLPGMPNDVTHAKIAEYIAGLDVFKNHLRVYDSKKMRTTYVGTRWDLVCQDDLLLMKTIQPICDRLRYDLPEFLEDSRRVVENHNFRQGIVAQLLPKRGVIRYKQLDDDPYLIGMPGGVVADLRPGGELRKMQREDFITRRLGLNGENKGTPVYDYFLRSISSANDQAADLEWMAHLEWMLGYCLIGHCDYNVWPIWSGEGGNGKTELAKLIQTTLGDFCAVVRWSELTHDERGGDNTNKRLNFKLLQSRVALVEEMGQTGGINRVLETSTIKQLTGGGELIGADLYQSEVKGQIKFKMISLMNQPPYIEPDAAMKRRVQVFPFRAVFDEKQHPGCLREAMERKSAPDNLRANPYRISALLREERPGILYKWIEAARRFIANGENLDRRPSSIQAATDAVFLEADIHARLCERLEFGTEFDLTRGELLSLAETFFRESGRDPREYDVNKMARMFVMNKGCNTTSHIERHGRRNDGWKGVRVRSDAA